MNQQDWAEMGLEELFIKEFGNERTQKTDGSEIEVTEHEVKEVRPQ